MEHSTFIWWSIQDSYDGAFKIGRIEDGSSLIWGSWDGSSLICRIMLDVCESKRGGLLKRWSRIWWRTCSRIDAVCCMLEYPWSIMYSSIFVNQEGGRPWKDVCMYVCMHAFVVWMYLCVCMHVWIYVCMCVYECKYVCVCIHPWMHA